MIIRLIINQAFTDSFGMKGNLRNVYSANTNAKEFIDILKLRY
jgi:hypothetical protein